MASPFYWAMPNAYNVDDPGLSVDPNFTTVMLRNIPNKYTTKMLLEVLDKRFAKQYDYVYLPVDFVNLCNVGYCFLNLKSPEARARFYRHFHNQKVKEVLPGFNSKKVLKQVCEVNKAKVQGAKENIRRIRQMSMLMQRLKDHPDWVPLQFDNNGNAIPLDLDTPAEPKRDSQRKEPGAPGSAGSSHRNSVNNSNGAYGTSNGGTSQNMPSPYGTSTNPGSSHSSHSHNTHQHSNHNLNNQMNSASSPYTSAQAQAAQAAQAQAVQAQAVQAHAAHQHQVHMNNLLNGAAASAHWGLGSADLIAAAAAQAAAVNAQQQAPPPTTTSTSPLAYPPTGVNTPSGFGPTSYNDQHCFYLAHQGLAHQAAAHQGLHQGLHQAHMQQQINQHIELTRQAQAAYNVAVASATAAAAVHSAASSPADHYGEGHWGKENSNSWILQQQCAQMQMHQAAQAAVMMQQQSQHQFNKPNGTSATAVTGPTNSSSGSISNGVLSNSTSSNGNIAAAAAAVAKGTYTDWSGASVSLADTENMFPISYQFQ